MHFVRSCARVLHETRLRVVDDDPLLSWRSRPDCDKDATKLNIEAGTLAGCMVISAELEDGRPIITLQRASYSMEHGSYDYLLICDAHEAFDSVGHAFATRDLRESAHALLSNRTPAFFDIGFIGDAMSALESTAVQKRGNGRHCESKMPMRATAVVWL